MKDKILVCAAVVLALIFPLSFLAEKKTNSLKTYETAFLNPDRRLRNRSQYHAHTARVRLTQITRKKRKVKAARSTLRKTPRDREHDQGDSRLRKLL